MDRKMCLSFADHVIISHSKCHWWVKFNSIITMADTKLPKHLRIVSIVNVFATRDVTFHRPVC